MSTDDTLLIEARKIAADNFYRGVKEAVMQGLYDSNGEVVSVALAALRRGIEIGKASS